MNYDNYEEEQEEEDDDDDDDDNKAKSGRRNYKIGKETNNGWI
jgi:hypothetical protein